MPDRFTSEALEDLFDRLRPWFPTLTETEQRLGLALYALLLRGAPVRREELASAVWLPTPDVDRELSGSLRELLLRDEDRRVVGYAGLTIQPTIHHLFVDDVHLYTWCPWDGLFIPELLGRQCTVSTECPSTGAPIEIVVGPDSIEAADPSEAIMSLVVPEKALCECATGRIAGFCDHVRLLADREAGKTWSSSRHDVILLSLDEAFKLGQLLNETRYPTKTRSVIHAASPGKSIVSR